jgi:hypothetical protein
MDSARGGLARVRAVLHRPRLWRVTAALSALLFAATVAAASQGSLTLLSHKPVAGVADVPAWERWCSIDPVRQDRQRLAFCARIDGREISVTHGPGVGEVHLAVLSDFHLVIVRLPDGSTAPAWGSRIVAVGPLLRARDGQRELQAFWLEAA